MEINLQGLTVEVFNLKFAVRFYSVMILGGMIAGLILARHEARRLGENPEHVLNIAMLGAALGILGARLYHVLDQDNWPMYQANPEQILYIWRGGIGIFGALAGALVSIVVYARWRNLQLLRWLDIGAPAFLLGQAIGRWGNYFNQELFGRPTSLPWGIPIDLENVLSEAPQYAAAERFHPLFLYESLFSFLGVIVLIFAFRRFGPISAGISVTGRYLRQRRWRLRAGDLLWIYLIWYPTERFGLEFLRASKWEQAGIPMAQWISGILVIVAIVVLIGRHRRPVEIEASASFDLPRSRSALRRQRRRQTNDLIASYESPPDAQATSGP